MISKTLILLFTLQSISISVLQSQPIFTRIPSSVGGTTGIAVRITVPDTARYSGGAPVIVFVAGGWGSSGISPNGLNLPQLGFVEISFNYPGGGIPPNVSGGTYDMRGHHCVQALKDVIRFANGLQTDINSQTISQLVSPIVPLSNNVGLIGLSNGGNLTITSSGSYGNEIQNLAWIVNWESPVGDGMPGAEAGAYGSMGYYPNPVRNPAYNDTTGLFDYSKLKYHDTLKANRSGSYNLRGNFYFDMDNDNYPDIGSDYIMNPVMYDSSSVVKTYWSVSLLQNAYILGILPATPPSHVPLLSEAQNFWVWRNGEYWIDSATNKLPQLMFLSVASDTDHVQSALNHPHILIQYELFRTNGARFVRLNPDRSYVEYISGNNNPNATDNPGFTPYDNLTIRNAVEPENINTNFLNAAAVCELADRTYTNNLDPNLNSIIISIKRIYGSVNENYFLYQNYPNPFNPSTKIRFSIPKSSFVNLKVYNILGKEIAILVQEELKQGNYEVSFDSFRVLEIASGTYFYVMNTDDFFDCKKFILLK